MVLVADSDCCYLRQRQPAGGRLYCCTARGSSVICRCRSSVRILCVLSDLHYTLPLLCASPPTTPAPLDTGESAGRRTELRPTAGPLALPRPRFSVCVLLSAMFCLCLVTEFHCLCCAVLHACEAARQTRMLEDTRHMVRRCILFIGLRSSLVHHAAPEGCPAACAGTFGSRHHATLTIIAGPTPLDSPTSSPPNEPLAPARPAPPTACSRHRTSPAPARRSRG